MEVIAEVSRVADQSVYFIQDSLLSLARESDRVEYVKRDFLFRSGEWRGKVSLPPTRAHNFKKILIGHSDFSTTFFDIARLRLKGVSAEIYASNLSIPFRYLDFFRARPLPLGLTNPTKETDLHELFGDSSLIRQAISSIPVSQSNRKLRIYANFDTRTSERHRKQVWKICRANPQIISEWPVKTRDGRLHYLKSMRDSGLVVCPRGNGLDTHRFYEALLVGAIPIVLKGSYSAAIGHHFSLPLITLRSWKDLQNSRQIIEDASQLAKAKVDYSPLTLEYWRQIIF